MPRSQTNIIFYSKTVGGGDKKQYAITASKIRNEKKTSNDGNKGGNKEMMSKKK